MLFAVSAGGGQVNNATDWSNFAQSGVPIEIFNQSSGTYNIITPVGLQTQSGQRAALHLGSSYFGGTYWPGNGYYNSPFVFGKYMSSSVVTMFQRFGHVFSGQKIAATGVGGNSESCCDPYRYRDVFGSTYTSAWPYIYGNASQSQYQPYETTLNTFSSSQSAGTYFYFDYRTDYSVNGGPGFYSHTANFYLYVP